MGLIDWLKSIFVKPAFVNRDVSRLESTPDKIGNVTEKVDLTGGPLKPKHHRRALRDPRLLPKKKSKIPFVKPKKVMSRGEADRLFSGTLLTRNRQIRDLKADVEQLRRYGLPIWETEADVAAALGCSAGMLRHFSIHREAERVRHYITFLIPKRSGGTRLIMAPKKKLKALQRKLQELLVSKFPVSPYAHAFHKGRSIKTGAEPHVNKAVLLRLDLKDFFPTVTMGRVRGFLISLGYGYPVATTLAVLMTESERQPVDVDGTLFHVPVTVRHCVQGAPTSPGICNAVTLKLDRRLAGLAKKHGFVYTRYADDMSFSGDNPGALSKLRGVAGKIISEEGFQLNSDKTAVMRRGNKQSVTGVCVNNVLGVSKKERRKIRAMLHRAKMDGKQLDAEIQGRLAYVQMLNKDQAHALRRNIK